MNRLRTSLGLSAWLGLMLVAAVLMAACGSASQATPVPSAPATEALAAVTNTPIPATPTELPSEALPTPTDTVTPPADTAVSPTDTPPSPTDTSVPPTEPAVPIAFGQTEDGRYFRGNPAAAVTVIDYSDFL